MTELPKELQETMDDLLDMEPGDLLDTIEAQNNHIEAMQKREDALVKALDSLQMVKIDHSDGTSTYSFTCYSPEETYKNLAALKSIKE